MYVALPHGFKGTHMSRFVEVLHAHEREISVESFRQMLGEMTQRLDATSGHIEMDFPYFVLKSAPVSGVQSLMNYEARLIGEIHDGTIDACGAGRRSGDEPLSVLAGHLGTRRTQPALAHQHLRAR